MARVTSGRCVHDSPGVGLQVTAAVVELGEPTRFRPRLVLQLPPVSPSARVTSSTSRSVSPVALDPRRTRAGVELAGLGRDRRQRAVAPADVDEVAVGADA